ncbi:MAG: glutamine synthetase [Vicinamibacteria bacterium]|nr:glutamine synthetase [Vicinamibacteria bacterium]
MKDLFHVVPHNARNAFGLRELFETHPEIRFVSLTAVDLGGNDTDEKIPARHFLSHIDQYLSGGVQTDGSSVVLPGIATLNDGKVDLVADPNAKWFVDYNYELRDHERDVPVGTLRIPSFLKHNGLLVDCRAVLDRAMHSLERRLLSLLREERRVADDLGLAPDEIVGIRPYAATELEFWVRTPGSTVEIEKLAASQLMQESYWKRTKGPVRSALEESMILLEKLGLSPEMGHKEVGGVKAVISDAGRFGDIMEQLEIDWRYDVALQAADNELLARILIKEVFRRHGLEVTFLAKPVAGVAGSGEHTHVSIWATLRDGSRRNLFSPRDPRRDYLNVLGWGALMGLLRNYDVVGGFVSASNDALNRLQPGFEAPVCVVASIGQDVRLPSRNRTVLVGLIRDPDDPLATRFEIRSPCPHTNTFLALSAFCQAMLDGMSYAALSGRSAADLQMDFCKTPGAPHPYLETERAYRSEEDVFERYDDEERSRLFGKAPATVWETIEHSCRRPERAAVLTSDGVFTGQILDAYRSATLGRWAAELVNRIIPENADFVRGCVRLAENHNPLDEQRFETVQSLRQRLMRDDLDRTSLFTDIREATARGDYEAASRLQIEMRDLMTSLRSVYQLYRRNLGP